MVLLFETSLFSRVLCSLLIFPRLVLFGLEYIGNSFYSPFEDPKVNWPVNFIIWELDSFLPVGSSTLLILGPYIILSSFVC